MNVLLNRHSGMFFISAGRKSDRATLGKQIKSRHGHLISKRQLLHDAVEPRSFIPFDFFCAIYPQNDFIAEPVADTVRSQSKDESDRSEEHTSELQSPYDLVCRLLLEKKKVTRARLTIPSNAS